MSTTKAGSTHQERIEKRKKRSRRYHPLMEPMALPEGFVETVHRILGSYVLELRSALSWLDGEIELPLVWLGLDLRLDREYGKSGAPDVDDVRATVTFHDGKYGPNCQRYTWAFADGPETQDHVRVRAYSRARSRGEERKGGYGGEKKGDERPEVIGEGESEGRSAEDAGRKESVDETRGASDDTAMEVDCESGGELQGEGPLNEEMNEGADVSQESEDSPDPEERREGVETVPAEVENGSALNAGMEVGDPKRVPLVDSEFPVEAAVVVEEAIDADASNATNSSLLMRPWIWMALIVLFGLAVFVGCVWGGTKDAEAGADGKSSRAFRRWESRECGMALIGKHRGADSAGSAAQIRA